jgi:hypothetical protein
LTSPLLDVQVYLPDLGVIGIESRYNRVVADDLANRTLHSTFVGLPEVLPLLFSECKKALWPVDTDNVEGAADE